MNKIYLDNQSTTPVDPKVLKYMLPHFSIKFGNPSSKTHSYGWEAETTVEIAREKIASLINSDPNEIIFTSGATEANNIALNQILHFNSKNHLITLTTEHKATLDVCENLKKHNINVSLLRPRRNGIIDIAQIENTICDKTSIITIMHVNNEVGVIQPIENIGKICKKNNIIFHVDAAQSLGKTPIDVKNNNIDLLSMTAHKIYGPKGIGALYVNKNFYHKIKPITFGGNQENSIRPGTLPVPLIAGFGKACEIAEKKMNNESKTILKIKNILLKKIKSNIKDVVVNGDTDKRLPGNLNLTFPSLNGQSIIASVPKLAISSGSACTSSSPKPSHVLLELGLSKELANSAIRIGIGRFNTIEDINLAAESIINAVKLKSK